MTIQNDIISKVKARIELEMEIGFIDFNDIEDGFIDRAIQDEIASIGLDYEDEMEFIDDSMDGIKEEVIYFLDGKYEKYSNNDFDSNLECNSLGCWYKGEEGLNKYKVKIKP